MKFTADHKTLSEAMAWAARAIKGRSDIPILAGMKIDASGTTVTVTASNHETTLAVEVEAHVITEGLVIVAGHLVRDLVNAMRGNEVEAVADDSVLEIRCGKSTYKLPTFPVEDYPTVLSMPDQVGTVSAAALKDIVKTVKFPIDDATPHDFIRGIRFEGSAAELRVVGMSQSVLSTMTAPWQHQGDFECHAKVGMIEPALSAMAGEVVVGYAHKILGFRDESRTAVVRCLAGDYVKWRQGLPSTKDFTVRADTAELEGAVRRAGLAVDPERPVYISVREDQVELTAVDKTAGSELVTVQSGGSVETGFAPAYFAACLAACPSPEVSIDFISDPRKPITIRPDDHPSVHIVMPRLPKTR